MHFHPARVAWVSWSLAWAAVWAVVDVQNAPQRACIAVMVHAIKDQPCALYGSTMGDLGLVILFAVLCLASVAVTFIPADPGKIRRHLAAHHQADPG